MSQSTSDVFCQSCGAKLDPTILGGTCSACMWSDIISGEQEEQASLADAPEIEGYLIHEEIGHGGMGIVYRASQESTGRDVALKIVAPYSLRATEAKQRFIVEAETMAAVEHSALLPLYDTGEDKHGRPWLTMQLAQGGTLAEKVESYKLDWRKSASLLVTLCDAVYYAHGRGILHRDLKPANILFDDEENAYVADFGLAKWADDDSGLTRSTSLLGSPAYLAPEAAIGGSKDTTTASDIYGLGAILYELLVGTRPYEGEHATQVLTRILDKPPAAPRQQLSDIPRDLEVIVLKAMARDPQKRYHSAAAFADDLTRWLEGRAIAARPVGMLEQVWSWARRNPALSTLSLLLMASLITGGILLWQANRKLTTALDDAEARVDFMTRELPTALAPIGRLDLLDKVFENVAEHYENNKQTDPESLARQADFLTYWAQIFRPRGQTHAAVERLELAMKIARNATSGDEIPIAAARSRVSTGQQLCEILIKIGQLDRARTILEETTAFAKDQKTDDLEFRVLTVRLAQEFLYLEKGNGDSVQAALHGEAALKKWLPLIPLLEENFQSPHSQKALVIHARYHHDLGEIYKNLKYYDQQRKILSKGLVSLEKLVAAAPGNTTFLFELNRYRIKAIKDGDQTASIKRDLFLRANTDAVQLTTRELNNIEWANSGAIIAIKISDYSWQLEDYDEYKRWIRIAAERQKPLYHSETTDLAFLDTLARQAEYVAERLAPDDWPLARVHFEAAVQLKIRLCQLDGHSDLRQLLLDLIQKSQAHIDEYEGKRAADHWSSKIHAQIEKEL